MKPLRITIVTFAWPPRNSIGAHRPLSWARYWSEAGAKVTVITAKKYSYDEPLDLVIPDLPGVDVVEVDYGTGSTSMAARVSKTRLAGIARKLFRFLRRNGFAIQNPRERWIEFALPRAKLLAQDTDIVVSTYDPRAVHQIAAAMKIANPNLIWIADYRDLWSLNHAPDWDENQRTVERAIEESTVGAHADMICSVSEELSQRQGEFIGKPWLCVTNGFDVNLQEIEEAIEKRTPALIGSVNIVYTGKLYPGLRDPSPILKVITEMEESGEIPKGSVCLNIYGSQADGLRDVMAEGQYAHCVNVHGHVSRETALRVQREADLLLLLESPRIEARGVLTGKIFEYMASGVPILSLGSRRDSAIGHVISSTATGQCTEDNPDLIRIALQDIVAGRTPDWFSPDLIEVGTYSREAQALKLLTAIRGLWSARSAQR